MILFAVLAHRDRACLEDLIFNLQAYCPACQVVVYNGGTDEALTTGLERYGVLVFPNSHPIVYGRSTYLLEVMQWAYSHGLSFDYLINIDSDMLLIKPGLEDYLNRKMQAAEYWGVGLTIAPIGTVKWSNEKFFVREFDDLWEPLLNSKTIGRVFNPGQVFKRSAVDKLIRFVDARKEALSNLLKRTQAFALDEVLYASLAYHSGCLCAPWPRSNTHLTISRFLALAFHLRRIDREMIKNLLGGVKGSIRDKAAFSVRDVAEFLQDEDSYLLHPVPLRYNDPVRRFIRSRIAGSRGESAGQRN